MYLVAKLCIFVSAITPCTLSTPYLTVYVSYLYVSIHVFSYFLCIISLPSILYIFPHCIYVPPRYLPFTLHYAPAGTLLSCSHHVALHAQSSLCKAPRTCLLFSCPYLCFANNNLSLYMPKGRIADSKPHYTHCIVVAAIRNLRNSHLSSHKLYSTLSSRMHKCV